MSKFATTKRKFGVIELNQDDAWTKLKDEKIIKVKLRPETFIKPNFSLSLISGYEVVSTYNSSNTSLFSFSFFIENLTDDLMMMMKPMAIFYGNSAISLSASYLFWNYMWEKIDNNNYKLHTHVSTLSLSKQTFVDISLHYYNHSLYTVLR